MRKIKSPMEFNSHVVHLVEVKTAEGYKVIAEKPNKTQADEEVKFLRYKDRLNGVENEYRITKR